MPDEPENSDIIARFRIALLINNLVHRDKAIRQDAEEQLLRQGKEAVPQLLEVFESEWKTYLSRHYRIRHIGKRLKRTAIIAALLLMGVALLTFSSDMVALSGFLCIVFMGLGFILTTLGRRTPPRLSAIYDLLMKTDNPHLIGIILEMYSADRIWLSKEAFELLTQNLFSIELSQWENLTRKQREALYQLLEQRGQINTKHSFEFSIVTIAALEQLGDTEAIPAVQHIAKHGCNDFLRREARKCLSHLRMRREEQSTRQILLRASQPEGGNDELLRVPTHAPDTESEQLLRIPREGE